MNDESVVLKKILAVTALDDRTWTVRVEWENGKADEVDLSEIVNGYASLAPVRDPGLFRQVQVGEWGWSIDFWDDIEIMNTTLWRLT